MNAPVTFCTTQVPETGKSGETDSIGNGEFLRATFGELSTEACPVIVSFPDNPALASAKLWAGRPWPCDQSAIPGGANNYFSLAAFRRDRAGQYRRRKTQFGALHAVLVDDLGGKLPTERLTLPPSWVVETSAGNHQAGYLLREPLTDGSLAERLIRAMLDADLCNLAPDGAVTQLARLPVGVNSKHAPPFQCRLLCWAPQVRYGVEELVAGLELELPPELKRRNSRSSEKKRADDESVWLPRPRANAVLSALRDHDLYKEPLGEGKHEITCPWSHQHADEIEGGTILFEADDSWPIGGFKCNHSTCAERHIRDVLAFLNITTDAARMKPTIRIVAGELHRVVDAAERELAQAGRHYQSGGLIVTVLTDPGTHETRVQNVTPPALVRALSAAATWEKFDKRADDWLRTDPPSRHVGVLFDSSSYAHLPVLSGLARQPYLRPDASLMSAAGYDSVTGMFGVFDAREFSVPHHPSRSDAEAALCALRELLSEFAFASESDLASALSAILTATIRSSLPAAPMFHVCAHMVGSGKSYLCLLITVFATPRHGTPTAFPADEEECRKLLLAELLRAPAVIEFDNLTGDLVPHKSLCTALTSEHISGRILGVSKTATVSTRTLFLSSGNNVGPVRDMTRRCISVRLSPQLEVPAARTFQRPDLVAEVLRRRGHYVSAALTIICAWIAAGRPKTPCKPLASYGQWSDLCRQPLLWLGMADPAASVFEAMAEDPDQETLARLLIAWEWAFGKAPAMVRDAVRLAESRTDDHIELREILHEIAGERDGINRRKVGWWIKRHAGRIVDGRRFVRASGNRSAEAWRVESVSPVSSGPRGSASKNGISSNASYADAYARASCGE
jgi:hypothetical protein